MELRSSVDTSPSTERMGKLSHIIRAILLNAWPMGLVFATFSFFPFHVRNPLNHSNPISYISFWTVVGVVAGLYNWRRQKASE